MKALLLSKYRHLEIAEVPTPRPGPDEVLVRVAACGICGSDVHGYDGSSGRRIPPLVMGHEAAGSVAALGAGVTDLTEGDRVVFDSTIFCGMCSFCLQGEINLCDKRKVLGVSCADYCCAGAFAEFVAVPRHVVHRLPENLSFSDAAMLEAVSVALHAVSLSNIVAGEAALVLGAGMIGLLTVQALRVAGCSTVYVADVDASRLKLADSLGAEPLLARGKDLVSQVAAFTEGKGVDVAVEAVGLDETVRTAIDCVGKGGRVTLVGNVSPEVALPLQKVVTRQIRLQGSCASAGEYPQAIDLVASGKIQVKPLITAVAPLEEGPQWFERLYSREPNLLKVILTPGKVETGG
ncbi:MAG TPA: galactitol-1-phosphate 5-dehydrogenase [Verrucomicrobiae bacterium]|jgi:L-iditol 2-dehydrogenase|nr:galactitol-1-phosphate 5-dehydrogenase [Verrucomicrobiae bacterium]